MIFLPFISKDIPRLYEQQDKNNDIVYLKFHIEQSDWCWYILEYSELQKMFYAYVMPEAEFQYVTIDQLTKISYEYDVHIHEDYNFKRQALKNILNY